MAAVIYATVADYKAYQVVLGSQTNEQIQFRLNSARDRITSCLRVGHYDVAAIVAVIAAGDYYSTLKELNIVIAHLALTHGAAASDISDTAGKTNIAHRKWIEDTLEMICDGNMELTSEAGGVGVLPPTVDTTNSPHIVADSRESGIDLVSPDQWKITDTLRSDW